MSLHKDEPLFSFYGGKKFSFSQLAKGVGPGWEKLLEDLMEQLLFLGWDGGMEQIKEKFGGLRFYYRDNLEGIAGKLGEAAVEHAENLSLATCEVCGEYGTTKGSKGWVKTLCEACRKAEEAR